MLTSRALREETVDTAFAGQPVLVTGGAGFIGSHLVDALVTRGARVRVLDDLSSGSRANLAHHGERVELVVGDLRDFGACVAAARDARFVFHLAAVGSVPRSMEDPATSIAVNVTGTANVFAAARDAGVERIVYASSSSVYGDSTGMPKREGEEGRPLSPYALSKVMGEELAATFARCFALSLVGLRFFNIYGPRQSATGPYAAVIPRFLAAALAGAPMEIEGDGEQSRDFTYVEDAVQAALLAALAGSAAPPRHLPPRPGDVRHSLADLTLARSRLGYAPRVELPEGMRRTWEAAQHSRTTGV